VSRHATQEGLEVFHFDEGYMSKASANLCQSLALIGALSAIDVSAARAQESIADHLTLHGYLSQAYAKSSDLPIAGITSKATTDYRVAALQFRYSVSDNDNVVVQLKHRRLGTSLVPDAATDLEVDWAFFAHRFGSASVRVGRVPIPLGIYNETRNVGTIIPFYRAPTSFYIDGIESLDGIALSHRAEADGWALESTVYGGGLWIKSVAYMPDGPLPYTDRAENNYGAQLWVSTPWTGLRVGGAMLRLNLHQGPMDFPVTVAQGSIDGTFDHFIVRGEYHDLNLNGVRQSRYYVQTQVKATEKLSINGQLEHANARDPMGLAPQYENLHDVVGGASYAFERNLVFKVEEHYVRGFGFDMFLNPTAAPRKSNYFMASMAVSF
jgi:hypothetical protein